MKKRALLTLILSALFFGNSISQDYNYSATLSQRSAPGRIKLDQNGACYVTHPTAHQVLKISLTDGSVLHEFGQQGVSGKSNTLLNSPSDVDIDSDGNIYIADRNNYRIIKYDATYTYLEEIDLLTKTPEGVTVGPDGKLYICYSGDVKGLLIYNGTNLESNITSLSTDRFRDPKKVKFDPSGQLYIADRNTGIIKINGFEGNKALVGKIIKKENGSTIIVKSEGLTFSYNGSMIVTSSGDKSGGPLQGLYRFDMNGALVNNIGSTGSNTGNDGFSGPLGIDSDMQDNIYIADKNNNRIQVWQATDNVAPSILSFSTNNTTSDVTIDFAINEISSFYALIREEGQTAPDVAEIINPAPEDNAFNINYTTPHKNVSHTQGGLEKDKTYIIYYVAVDQSNNTSTLQLSDPFLTSYLINHLVTDQKESNSITLKVNSPLSGTAYYALETYTGQAPAYTTTQAIKDAPGMVSFAYPNANEDLTFSINNLNEDTPYRISLFIEGASGDNTQIEYAIYSTWNELETMFRRYTEWCIGDETIDYSNSLINARYQAIYSRGLTAIANLPLYDLNNPGETYDLVDNPDHINHIKELIRETLFPLALLYNVPGSATDANPYYKNINTRNQLLDLYRYLSARGFVSGCKSEFRGGGVYLGLTSYFYASMLMKTDLDQAGLLDEVSANMAWWTRWELAGITNQPWTYEQKSAIKQADLVRTFYNNHLITLLTLPDHHLDKTAQMAFLTDVYNEACEISYGWGGFIKPDYTGYHHHGIWGNAYITEALHVSATMAMISNGTSYAYTQSGIDNLSQAMLAYRYYCNKYDNPKSTCGRFPTNQGDLLLHIPSFAYLQQLDNGTLSNELGEAFKRLWNAPLNFLENELATDVEAYIQFRGGMGGLQQMIKLSGTGVAEEAAPTGNRVFPYANMQIHRRDEWMVSLKGYSKYVWDYETNGQQNWFGRNQSAGALEIFALQDSYSGGATATANGWNENGYDWNHVAGATAFYLPAWTDHDMSWLWAKFSPEYFVGGVSLNQQNGVFAMKYVDVRETSWLGEDYKLSANKSYFMFDDQIVCLGSDIKSIHPSYQVHTTLFQNYLADISTPSNINGTESTGLGLDYSQTDNSSVYLTDVTGNSYFMRDGNSLKVTRSLQSSRDNRDTKDTQGNFINAWLDHGDAVNSNYEYMLWVQAPAGSIEQVAANPDNYYVVEQKDDVAHVVKHVQKKMTGYAIFKANHVIDKGVIYSTNNDCIAMHEETTQGINLSVAHPDLGWMAKDDHLYQVWHVKDHNRWLKPVEQSVEVTLKGRWQITVSNPAVSLLGYDELNDRTTLLFKCIDGQTLDVQLEPEVPNNLDAKISNNGFLVYPNPTSGEFSIMLEQASQRIEIIDIKGSIIIMHENVPAGTFVVKQNLYPGTYFIHVLGLNTSSTKKLMVV